MTINKLTKFFLKLTISLALLAWVVFKVDWNEFFEYIGRIEIWQIGLYLLLVIIGIAVSSYKWKLLAEHKNIEISYKDYFRYYLTGTFINNFMPSFLGGDAYRAYQIGRPTKKYASAASTVMMDRITGFISAMILSLFFSILNHKIILENYVLFVANLVIILFLAGYIFLIKFKNNFFLAQYFKKIIPEKIIYLFRELNDYNKNGIIISRAISWGCVFSFIGMALANYVLFYSLGIHINFLNFLSVIFLITIVSSIPITINNIGLKEWAYVTFFGIFGLNQSLVVIAAIISRFLQMFLSFLALPTYLRTKNIKEIKKEEELLPEL